MRYLSILPLLILSAYGEEPARTPSNSDEDSFQVLFQGARALSLEARPPNPHSIPALYQQLSDSIIGEMDRVHPIGYTATAACFATSMCKDRENEGRFSYQTHGCRAQRRPESRDRSSGNRPTHACAQQNNRPTMMRCGGQKPLPRNQGSGLTTLCRQEREPRR